MEPLNLAFLASWTTEAARDRTPCTAVGATTISPWCTGSTPTCAGYSELARSSPSRTSAVSSRCSGSSPPGQLLISRATCGGRHGRHRRVRLPGVHVLDRLHMDRQGERGSGRTARREGASRGCSTYLGMAGRANWRGVSRRASRRGSGAQNATSCARSTRPVGRGVPWRCPATHQRPRSANGTPRRAR